MRNLIFNASSLVLAFIVSGCATHDTAKFNSAQSLAATSRYVADVTSEQVAKTSYSWGDKYTAANLFLQAEKANNTVMNRFNLATAYETIGKTGQASDIYESLVLDGQYTWLSEDSRHGEASWLKTFNVGDEAARRLTALDSTLGPTGSTGDEFGLLSNEEARVLDQSAEDRMQAAMSVITKPF